MRFARKLALLATMALAALALAAPSAFGQALQTTNEATGADCPSVSAVGHAISGGCVIHASSEGEITLRQHIFGIESTVSVCENEFTGRLGPNGAGFINQQTLGDHGDCAREPCDEETGTKEKRPWPATGREQFLHPGKEGVLRAVFCVETLTNTSHPSGETNCTVDVPFTLFNASTHRYEFGEPVNEMPGIGTAGFRCELIGHWLTEATPGPGEDTAEVIHL